MATQFDILVKRLYEEVNAKIQVFLRTGQRVEIVVSDGFQRDFFSLVDYVNFSLMEDKDQFYGYFLLQMSRELRFDISSATAVNFKDAKYIIYFNPIMFLNLDIRQMQSSIKHEILHVLSMHLVRAKELHGRYDRLAVNMAMDIVVNAYLEHLPTYAVTLEKVNLKYSLELEPFRSFEYYAEQLQIFLDLLDDEKEKQVKNPDADEWAATEFDPGKTHDIWRESNDYDDKVLKEFAVKVVNTAQKSKVPAYLDGLISSIRSNGGELPWNLYLNRLMGTVASNRKKTITRRNRRQPDRLDLRGELRDHKARIAVALDISGSISDEEFKQAIREVLSIVRNYNHEIEIVECDDEIRRTYKVKSEREMKERLEVRGATRYSPVFDYANHRGINLLIYFTDGKGEDKLTIVPGGYKVLWIISGRGDQLSLSNPHGAVRKLGKIEVKTSEMDMKDVLRDGFSMNNQE